MEELYTTNFKYVWKSIRWSHIITKGATINNCWKRSALSMKITFRNDNQGPITNSVVKTRD